MSTRPHRHSQPSYHHQLKLPVSLSTGPTARNLGQSRPYPAARPSRSNRASATRSSRSLDEGSSSDLVAISFYGYVETVLDSLLLVEAFRRGSIQGLTGRIPANQRERVIRSGSTFIFLESATDIRRWTDGKKWTPSRVGGEYLVYREPTNEEPQNKAEIPENSELAKRMRSLVVSLTDGSRTEKGYVKPEGICKRTIVITSENRDHYHIISYYHPEDVLEECLKTPSQTPWMMAMKDSISQDLLNTHLFKRNPPRVSRDPGTNLLRYEGEEALPEGSTQRPLLSLSPVLIPSQTVVRHVTIPSYPGDFNPTSVESEIVYPPAPSPSWTGATLTVNGIGILPTVPIEFTPSPMSTNPALPPPSYPYYAETQGIGPSHVPLGRQGSIHSDLSTEESNFVESPVEASFSIGLPPMTDFNAQLAANLANWYCSQPTEGPLLPAYFVPMPPPAPFFPPMHGNGTISPALLTPSSEIGLNSLFLGFEDEKPELYRQYIMCIIIVLAVAILLFLAFASGILAFEALDCLLSNTPPL